MLLEPRQALLLERAQIRRFAGRALQRGEQLCLGRVGRVAQRVDGMANAASFGFLTRRGAERAVAEQQQREENEASQSAAFGGGPI